MTRKEAFFHGVLLALGVYQLQNFLISLVERAPKSGTQIDAANLQNDLKMIVLDSDAASSKFIAQIPYAKNAHKKIASYQ